MVHSNRFSPFLIYSLIFRVSSRPCSTSASEPAPGRNGSIGRIGHQIKMIVVDAILSWQPLGGPSFHKNWQHTAPRFYQLVFLIAGRMAAVGVMLRCKLMVDKRPGHHVNGLLRLG